ncbi:hypothetical protein GCM10027405_17650 [Arthrobacter alkaliphilus]
MQPNLKEAEAPIGTGGVEGRFARPVVARIKHHHDSDVHAGPDSAQPRGGAAYGADRRGNALGLVAGRDNNGDLGNTGPARSAVRSQGSGEGTAAAFNAKRRHRRFQVQPRPR